MALPLATTTISVLRVPADADRDPYAESPAAEVVASGIRAAISGAIGSENEAGGSQEVLIRQMECDPFEAELHHRDEVRDERTGKAYAVEYAETREGMGMDHFAAELRRISGVVS